MPHDIPNLWDSLPFVNNMRPISLERISRVRTGNLEV